MQNVDFQPVTIQFPEEIRRRVDGFADAEELRNSTILNLVQIGLLVSQENQMPVPEPAGPEPAVETVLAVALPLETYSEIQELLGGREIQPVDILNLIEIGLRECERPHNSQ